MFHWIKVVWNIWPELMSLFKHVREQLPNEHHIPAIKHVLGESKALVTPLVKDQNSAGNVSIEGYSDSLRNLESFEDL